MKDLKEFAEQKRGQTKAHHLRVAIAKYIQQYKESKATYTQKKIRF